MEREKAPMLDYLLDNEDLQIAINDTCRAIYNLADCECETVDKKLEEHLDCLLENQRLRALAVVDPITGENE